MGYLNRETETKEILPSEEEKEEEEKKEVETEKAKSNNNNNNNSKKKSPASTAGWLRLGDLGYIDEDGFLVSLGRAYEAITLRSGAVVMPQPLEQQLRVELPCVRHVVCVGEQEDHLAALMTLQTKDDGGEVLTEEAQRWFRHARYS